MAMSFLSMLDPETRALLEKYAAQIPEIGNAFKENLFNAGRDITQNSLGVGEAVATVGSGLIGAIPAGLQGMASLMNCSTMRVAETSPGLSSASRSNPAGKSGCVVRWCTS